MEIPLKSLGLEPKWPKLAKLLTDLAEFQRRQAQASAKVATLQGQLPTARSQDLDAEAKALRGGRKPPEPTHEPKLRRELEERARERERLDRVIQNVREELGAYLAVHQPALFADVLEARQKIAAELAEHARAALSAYARYEDLARHVKALRPATPINEDAPVQRLTQTFVGIHSTRSDGPARGHVEEILGYLASLGENAAEGGTDAA